MIDKNLLLNYNYYSSAKKGVIQTVSVSDLLSLKGRVALVTGAKRGIGRAIALTFAEAGADVAVCDVEIEGDELGAVAEEAKKLGRHSLAIEADVSRKDQVQSMVEQVVGELGQIDILANNAGISGMGFMDNPDEAWDRVIDVNLKGCYLCSRAVAEGMIQRKKGSIISIASVEGLRGGVVARSVAQAVQALQIPDLARPAFTARPYNISKAGIIMLTRVLARQLGAYGIRVNAIAPGGIKTEMIRMVWSQPEFLKLLEEQVPLGRIAEPAEIANVALFLASDASSYVTGHTLVADGGLLA